MRAKARHSSNQRATSSASGPARRAIALNSYLGKEGRSPYDFKRHAIHHSLYGVDIDPSATEIAKLRLWLSLVVDEDEVETIKPLPNLDYRVVAGDSLLGFPFRSERIRKIEELKSRFFDVTDHDAKVRLKRQIDERFEEAFANSKKSLGYEIRFDLMMYFSEVFFSDRAGFDVIIGNPPYVFGGNKGISSEAKTAYKQRYVSGSNKINLFTLFIERGTQLLRDGGTLTYILPNTLLRVTSYSNTRKYILDHATVSEIVDLDVGVFDKVTASTIIISLQNRAADAGSAATVKRGIYDASPALVPQSDWRRRGCIFDIFSSGGDKTLFEKLATGTELLETLCSRIRFGVVISGNFEDVVGTKKKSGKWKPFLEGEEIGPYSVNYLGRYLYYEPSLLHRSRTADIFESRKIMVQRITGGDTPLKATLDDEGFYNKESILNIILSGSEVSYEYVLAILNSKLANWFYRRRFTNGSKLTVNLSKEYVGQIPIKIPDRHQDAEVSALVRAILKQRRKDPDADVGEELQQLDAMIYRIYGLSTEEIALVERPSAADTVEPQFAAG